MITLSAHPIYSQMPKFQRRKLQGGVRRMWPMCQIIIPGIQEVSKAGAVLKPKKTPFSRSPGNANGSRRIPGHNPHRVYPRPTQLGSDTRTLTEAPFVVCQTPGLSAASSSFNIVTRTCFRMTATANIFKYSISWCLMKDYESDSLDISLIFASSKFQALQSGLGWRVSLEVTPVSNLVVAGLARFRQLNSSAKQMFCRFLTDLFQVLSDVTFLCGSASPASSAPCKGVGFDASVFQQLLVASGSFWAGSNGVWSGHQLPSQQTHAKNTKIASRGPLRNNL